MKPNLLLLHHALLAATSNALFMDPRSNTLNGGQQSSSSMVEIVPDSDRKLKHHAATIIRNDAIVDGGDDAIVTKKTNNSKAINKSSSDSFSLSFDKSLHKDRLFRQCLLAIIVYMAVGVIGFSRVFEHWPIVDSLYFSVVTFTTVGYGDLVPTTEAGKLFAIFYSFAGISIVGALLGYIGGNIIEAETRAIQATRKAARARMMAFFDRASKLRRVGRKKLIEESLLISSDLHSGKDEYGRVQSTLSRLFAIQTRDDGSKSLLRQTFDTLSQCYYIFVPFVALAFYIGKHEGWTRIASIYYAMATASTVGYGDVSPTSPRMRLMSLMFIPLAVISLGEILGRIAGYFIRKETERAEREFMDRRMTLDDLEAMDTDRDGEVDLFEFLTFMLGSMQKVDKEMMYGLKKLFQSLDETKSNSIQKEDLAILMTKENRDQWLA